MTSYNRMNVIVCILLVSANLIFSLNGGKFRLNHSVVNRRCLSYKSTDIQRQYHDINTPLTSLKASIDNVAEQIPSKIRIGSVPQFAIEGDSTIEQPIQVAAVITHFVITLYNLVQASSSISIHSIADIIPIILTIALSIVVGDFGTGVFHFLTDNYGSIKTPVFGSVCAAFQGHHITPWTITFRSFANNVHKICYGTIPALLAVTALPLDPLSKVFFTLFITWWMVSQEFHKWSHLKKVPENIKIFQDMGIILSKKEHGLHHTSPFEGHYCILTGVCNSFLDDSLFFRHFENVIFNLTGNKPNTWLADPELEKQTRNMYQ